MREQHSTVRDARSIARAAAALALAVVTFANITVNSAHAQACPFEQGGASIANEGVVLTRYALGLRGTPLVANTVFANSNTSIIEASVSCPSCGLDINGNGVFDITDATLMSRKLAGLKGAALTNGLFLGTGVRNTAAAVQSFLLTGCGSSTRVGGPNTNETQIVVDDLVSATPVAGIRVTSVSDALLPQAINLISGSAANAASALVQGGTIAGGGYNASDCLDPITQTQSRACYNRVTESFTTISGGLINLNSGFAGVISGGYLNTVSGTLGTVAGGQLNSAAGLSSVIGGGAENSVGGAADYGVVAGGLTNTASGMFSVVAGGELNVASGNYSWAGGRRAKTQTGDVVPVAHHGTFVWADSAAADFRSSGDNQFVVRAGGGAGFNAAPPNNTVALTVAAATGSAHANAFLQSTTGVGARAGILFGAGDATGANDAMLFVDQYNSLGASNRLMTLTDGTNLSASPVSGVARAQTFTSTSDRNVKTAFQRIDVKAVLARVAALPITSWAYKNEQALGVRHIGAVAQDFRRLFGVGYDDKSITSIDADGVALAAIQGLNQSLREAVATKDAEIADLRRKLEVIERKLGIR